MAPPFKLKPDDRLFERVAAGESLRRIAPDYGVDASNLSRFLRGGGAAHVAAARARAAAERAQVSAPPGAADTRGKVIASPRLSNVLDNQETDRAASGGRAPGQPNTSVLEPREFAEHKVRLAKLNGEAETAALYERWLAGERC